MTLTATRSRKKVQYLHTLDHQSQLNAKLLELCAEKQLSKLAKRQKEMEIHKMLRWGANANARLDNGRSPLREAVNTHQMEVARLLLQAGANPNMTDEMNWTPLHWAVTNFESSDVMDMCRLLVEHGAYALYPGLEGTPLDLARRINASADLIDFLESSAKHQVMTFKAYLPMDRDLAMAA